MSVHKVTEEPSGFSDRSIDFAAHLQQILCERLLTPVFQPIVDLRAGTLIGYEGLIRGPANSPLHSPLAMFKVAAESGLTTQLEVQCGQCLLERFATLNLPGRLFLNISPAALPLLAADAPSLSKELQHWGLVPRQIVFELTEHPAVDPHQFYAYLAGYRASGIQLALDDLGDGHSSLRRWSDSRPDYVKVDMHFVRGVHLDPLKQQFLRSIRDIARESGALIVAEGIEQCEELEFLISIDIRAGQGFYFARPQTNPPTELAPAIRSTLRQYRAKLKSLWTPDTTLVVNAGSLLRTVPHASPDMSNNDVSELFGLHPQLQSIPVVEGLRPRGLILRDELIGRFARPYQRELYGRRSCTMFMDASPPIAEQNTSLQQLSNLLIQADSSRLVSDFIITHQGRYLGIGTSYDLLRELTQAQITAAKHANPLTQLPGNVPVNLRIEQLLADDVMFYACYADLDNFKPFNDTFGYVKGDEVIQLTGKLLTSFARGDDFVGHIGGDDFLILWCSADWKERCEALLQAFGLQVRAYLLDSGLMRDGSHQGYFAHDRGGKLQYFNWPSISLGVVQVHPVRYQNAHQISSAAAEAKGRAKTLSGNSLFVETAHDTQPDIGSQVSS